MKKVSLMENANNIFNDLFTYRPQKPQGLKIHLNSHLFNLFSEYSLEDPEQSSAKAIHKFGGKFELQEKAFRIRHKSVKAQLRCLPAFLKPGEKNSSLRDLP